MPRILLGAIVVLTAWELVLVLTGGVDLRGVGIRFSSRDPFRAACVAAALLLIYAVGYGPQARAHLAILRAAVERRGPMLAMAAGLYTLGIALRFGCNVAAGADEYGYVSQADLWLAGDLIVEQPIARDVPWPSADVTFAPLGYRPAPSAGAIVPTYPSGLPLLMALAKSVGGACGSFYVVPLLGALTVFLTYRLGVRLASRSVGVAAAVLMAASPAFVGMVITPMSDVPTTCLLLAATLMVLSPIRARALWTGLALAMVLLLRPNLAPLAALFVAFIGFRAPDRHARRRDIALVVAGLLPGIVSIAAIHTWLYGAPWRSGYGSVGGLYAWHHGAINALRYPRWLLETQTPLIAAVVWPFVAARRLQGQARANIIFLGVLMLALWGSYLFYLVFDEWTYLRFLLPAFPPMLVLAVRGWQLAARRFRWEVQAATVTACFLVVLGFQVERVQGLGILGRWESTCAQIGVGEFVDRMLPRNAVIVTMFYSGTLRYYGHRLTLRYDALDREWWPQALEVLIAKGYRPYVVLADWEEPQFRQHFGLAEATPLPGTVIAELGRPALARVYDPLAATVPGRGPDSAPDASPDPAPNPAPDLGPNSARTPVVIAPGAPCPCMWRRAS